MPLLSTGYKNVILTPFRWRFEHAARPLSLPVHPLYHRAVVIAFWTLIPSRATLTTVLERDIQERLAALVASREVSISAPKRHCA